MEVLAIGNSFSQDATRYLFQIARAAGTDLRVTNLMFPGCPLSNHYRYMLSRQPKYRLEHNGFDTGFMMSMDQALLSRDWDVVTIQQVSHYAPKYETYQPYLKELIQYIRTCAPKARILLQETWAYEADSYRLTQELKYNTPQEMYDDLHAAYLQAAKDEHLEIIPSGTVLFKLNTEKGLPVHRDTFHASFGLGRYALGLTWFRKLTGKSVLGNTYRDFDRPVTEEEIAVIQQVVEETV